MNNARLYSDFSSQQQNESDDIASQFLSSLNGFKFDSLLDIGCGPGTTLVDNILPHLRVKPRKVVGVDSSQNMILLAKEKYINCSFYEFDIQHDLPEGSKWLEPEGFDLVTSFFCHHWIRNESKALSNIYDLMKTGGTFLMVFPVRAFYYDVVDEMSRSRKYREYLEDVDKFMCPYYYEMDPTESLRAKLVDAAFRVAHIEIRENKFVHPSVEHLEKSFGALNVFNMPENVALNFEKDCTMRMSQWMEKVGKSGLVNKQSLIISLVTK